MENAENLVLGHLNAIRSEIGTVREDVRELKTRMSNVEGSLGQVMSHIGHVASMLAFQQVVHDRMNERIERIEKRLELA